MLGNEVPCENEISSVGRGRFSDIYYVVYDHYHFEKGLEMSFTAKAVEQTAARSRSVLTMYKGPRSKPLGAQPAPRPENFALESGALSETTAKPDAGAISVEAGKSVQDALDTAGKNGGWVVLGKGVHALKQALHMPSGVTLAGQGAASIVWLNAGSDGPAILAEHGPHDITLRDFVVEGAATVNLPSDPNSARRTRSRPGAPQRAGISVSASNDGTAAKNIRFSHVTVRNCTGPGVMVMKAAGVDFEAVSLTDDGSPLSLTLVDGCKISRSRLNNSPVDCGLFLSGCSDITVTSNEVARNKLEGIRIDRSNNVRINGNLIEGNETDGVWLVRVTGKQPKLEVVGNLIQYNGDRAIKGASDIGATLRDNRERDNKN